MASLIIGMLFAVVLALAVVAIVAIPARREGRDFPTPRGEEMLGTFKDKAEHAKEAARERAPVARRS